jgi:hypothetical protein
MQELALRCFLLLCPEFSYPVRHVSGKNDCVVIWYGFAYRSQFRTRYFCPPHPFVLCAAYLFPLGDIFGGLENYFFARLPRSGSNICSRDAWLCGISSAGTSTILTVLRQYTK